MRWREDEPRPNRSITWLIGSILVVAWILTSAAPASAQITEHEARHYAWAKLSKAAPWRVYQPILNSCYVTGSVGECNFTVLRSTARGVIRCTGRLRVTKREFEKPRGYAPTPAPVFVTILVGDVSCLDPS